jgi:glycosyltransferase involved in cell wall biosynthesis
MLAGFGGEVDQVSPEGRPGIAETVWPWVKARVLSVRLQVVGRGPTPAERTLVDKTGDAELHADIPDPKSYLRQASVAVNPAVSGSGVNIKLVEYLSVGVPVVSTSRGMGGIDLLVGEDLLVADAPADFADHIVRLLTSDETAHRVAAGHQTAMRILDVRTSLATMASALNESKALRTT